MNASRHSSISRLRNDGLTLLEILLSTAVLGIVLIAIAATMSSMQNIWTSVREKSDQYRTTRLAMDTIAARLSSAMLAPRWEHDPEATGTDERYVRQSDLHFVCGPADELLRSRSFPGNAIFFQAPLGERGTDGEVDSYDPLHQALSAWGYFVELGSDAGTRPPFLQDQTELAPARMRFRLMEFRQPAHELTIFQSANSNQTQPELATESQRDRLYGWFRKPVVEGNLRDRPVSMVADNVLAILLTPVDPENDGSSPLAGDDGVYDTRRHLWQPNRPQSTLSRHRLPPVVQLTVIAMSEDAWTNITGDQIAKLRSVVDGRFRDTKALKSDLNFVDTELTRLKMPHRILTMKIRMNDA